MVLIMSKFFSLLAFVTKAVLVMVYVGAFVLTIVSSFYLWLGESLGVCSE
jgi:hypothetical protein